VPDWTKAAIELFSKQVRMSCTIEYTKIFFGMLLAIAPLVLIDIEAIHPPYFLALIIMS